MKWVTSSPSPDHPNGRTPQKEGMSTLLQSQKSEDPVKRHLHA